VEKLPLDVAFRHHNRSRLFADEPITLGLTSQGFDLPLSQVQALGAESPHDWRQMAWGSSEWPLTLSQPERALFELLDELPHRESFHQVDMLMADLANLRPRRLAKLLADCRSVKVKRLFFFFADRHPHTWRRHLHPDAFDLGTGKRVLVKGGKLDPKYLITVPGDLDGVQ
jgi:hypothetical protein